MTRMWRRAAAIAIGMLLSASPALAATSLGIYQTPDRKMDFELIACGPNDANMCVKVLDARDSARKPRVLEVLGTYMVQNARPAGKNKWRGSIKFQGYTMVGTMTLTPGEKVVMAGCAYILFCDEITLIPEE